MTPIVLVITALKDEHDALQAVTEGVSAWRREIGEPIFTASLAGRAGPIQIVSTWLPKMGLTSAVRWATKLVAKYEPSVLAMCGVCAGHPKDTSIGDVIIADRVFGYNEGKATEQGFQGDLWVHEMHENWLHAAQELEGVAEQFYGYGQADEDTGRWWVLEQLLVNRDFLTSSALSCYLGDRRVEILNALMEEGYVELDSAGKFHLAPAGRTAVLQQRAIHGAAATTLPYHVRVGPIGSGVGVQADPSIWSRIKDRGGMRKTLGIEMEGAAIGYVAFQEKLPFVVVKGVMDHADGSKSDGAKPFAARVSAEVLCFFLRRVVVPARAASEPPHGPRPSDARNEVDTSLEEMSGRHTAGGEPGSPIANAGPDHATDKATDTSSPSDDDAPRAGSRLREIGTWFGVAAVASMTLGGFLWDWLSPHCWEIRGAPEHLEIDVGESKTIEGGNSGTTWFVDDPRGLRAAADRSAVPDGDEIAFASDLTIHAPIVFTALENKNGFCWVDRLSEPEPDEPYPDDAPAYRLLDSGCLDSRLDLEACGGRPALDGSLFFVLPPGTRVILTRSETSEPSSSAGG